MFKRTLLAAAVSAFVLPAISHAAISLPSNTHITVDCKTSIVVGKTVPETDGLLMLEFSDPIFRGPTDPCENGGIRLINGPGTRDQKTSRNYTIDCGLMGIIRGTKGRGIDLRGYGMNVSNCYIQGFTSGIVSTTDGGVIENNIVNGAAADGFVVKGSAPLSLVEGVSFDQNFASNNGGWGFLIKGNSVLLSGGSQPNEADDNGKGGFFLKGNYHEISGATATGNSGPGIVVDNNSCCYPNFLESVTATNNAGPGVLFLGRDDGFNCAVVLGQPVCFPSGFTTDFTVDGIRAIGNSGVCPTGARAVPPTLVNQVCPIVRGKTCGDAALNACLF